MTVLERRAWWVFGACAIVFVAGMVVATSGGVRGSDQFWYLGDTETLLRGDPPLSNNLYPRQLLTLGLERSPMIHDILPQRGVLPLARLIGPYPAWMVLNAAAMLLGALVLMRITQRISDPVTAALLAGALLLLPLPMSSATQMLAEAALVPFVALAMLLSLQPAGFTKYLALAVVLTLAVMTRVTMIPLLLLLPVAALAERAAPSRRVALAAWAGVLAIGGLALDRQLFSGVPLPGDTLAMAIGGTGMELWFTTEPVVLSLQAVMAKLQSFLRSVPEGPAVNRFLAASNWTLLLLGTVGAVALWRRGWRVQASFVAVLIAITLGTLVLYQNQVRYVLPAYPALLLATAPLVDRSGSRTAWIPRVVLPSLVALLVPVALAIAWTSRAGGLRDAAERERLLRLAEAMHGDGDVIYVGGFDQQFGYTMRPRVVLFVRSHQPEAHWARILEMPRWRWVACPPEDLDRLLGLAASAEIVTETTYRGRPLLLLRLEDGHGATGSRDQQ